MADRPPDPHVALPRPPRPRSGRTSADYSLLRRAQSHASDSTELLGFLALAVTLAALLVLAGATLTAAIVALVFLSPLLLLTSPLWLPAAAVLFFAGGAAFSACGLAVAAVASGTWAHQHLTGRHPVSAHRVENARGRVADTASHVSGGYYAQEYGGGYPHARVKDAAPGA